MSAAPEAQLEFAAFFDAMRNRAGRFAYVLTSSTAAADEIAQDAFVGVYRRWDSLDNPQAYLWRSIVNGARTWHTRTSRTAPLERTDQVGPDAEAIAVRIALGRLPLAEREVLVLRYFIGLTDREVALTLDRPLGSVKTTIRRSLVHMREALDG